MKPPMSEDASRNSSSRAVDASDAAGDQHTWRGRWRRETNLVDGRLVHLESVHSLKGEDVDDDDHIVAAEGDQALLIPQISLERKKKKEPVNAISVARMQTAGEGWRHCSRRPSEVFHAGCPFLLFYKPAVIHRRKSDTTGRCPFAVAQRAPRPNILTPNCALGLAAKTFRRWHLFYGGIFFSFVSGEIL